MREARPDERTRASEDAEGMTRRCRDGNRVVYDGEMRGKCAKEGGEVGAPTRTEAREKGADARTRTREKNDAD